MSRRCGSSGRSVVQAEPRGERVGDAGVGDVGVGVGDEVRDAAADHAVHQRALGVVGRHAVHAGQQQRVVGDQQLAPVAIASATVRGHGVDGEQDALHRSSGSPHTSPTASHDSAHRGSNQPSSAARSSARRGTSANLPRGGHRTA